MTAIDFWPSNAHAQSCMPARLYTQLMYTTPSKKRNQKLIHPKSSCYLYAIDPLKSDRPLHLIQQQFFFSMTFNQIIESILSFSLFHILELCKFCWIYHQNTFQPLYKAYVVVPLPSFEKGHHCFSVLLFLPLFTTNNSMDFSD